MRLGRGGQPLGFPRRQDRRGERAGDVVAGEAVLGELGGGSGHLGKPPLVAEQGGEAGMQPGPLAGQQVGIDGLAEQRVPERVSAAAIGHQ